MQVQHYKIKASADNRSLGKPGHPVYEDDDSDTITGFIDFVSDVDMCIYLFDEADVDFDCTVLASSVQPSVWQKRLHEIVEEDDEIYEFWAQVFGTTEEVY